MDVQAIAAGFHLEGLLPDADVVWFTDAFASGIQRRAADGTVETFLAEKPMVPALLVNEDGKIIFSGQLGLEWLDPESGKTGVLIDSVDGEPLPGVNEMIPDADGGVYFGLLDHLAIQEHRAPAPGAIYHLAVDGRVSVVNPNVPFPNGIGVSPDGRRLYCNETFSGTTAYDVHDDGTFGPPVRLLEMNDCDGLALDVNGDLWVTGFSTGDLLRLSPDGELLERVPTPAAGISNARFGGPGNRDIFFTATSPDTITEFASGGPVTIKGSKLYQGRTDVAGFPIPKTRFALS